MTVWGSTDVAGGEASLGMTYNFSDSAFDSLHLGYTEGNISNQTTIGLSSSSFNDQFTYQFDGGPSVSVDFHTNSTDTGFLVNVDYTFF